MTERAVRSRTHCVSLLEELSSYLDGELSPKRCAAMEAHLERCPCCGHLAHRLRRAVAICRAAGLTRLPADVRSRAKSRIAALLETRPEMKGSAAAKPRRQRRPAAQRHPTR